MSPINILLVEDNEGDILLTTEALTEGKIANKVDVVKDGYEAILYLENKGRYVDAATPDLILLDVNLPKLNGHEVLEKIKSKDQLKHLPVIMLSTSSSSEDIMASYKNQVNCYITKPVEAEDFLRVISSIEQFWISVVKLPSSK
ncbi:Response regulator receiver domain-containing protein [Gillisia sp. Hel1_33_143]|uniref:response regulator n=1 Tax=Gillisia sp. Hel1_33_143 TaxID=1336796 RepID=UPI00087B4417|nr:response regulator [Gillisia sp. Hel1_33_143]SDS78691.1 Response regulator receiver domain-containing protein [Gillisia sp. Hel1_33_143]